MAYEIAQNWNLHMIDFAKLIHIGVDFETASELDLGDVGATKYASHPSTHLLCLGYGGKPSFKGLAPRPASIWFPGQPFPPELRHAAESGHTFVAHNSQFDRQIWKHQLTAKLGIPLPSNWLCTASRCSVNGLPRGLDEACEALGFPGKDKDGQKSLKAIMAPNKKGVWLRDADPAAFAEHLAKTGQYCAVDIARMWQLFFATKPLSPWEQQYFELDQAINERGFAVDRKGVERILERLNEAYAELDMRVWDATGGMLGNVNSLPKLSTWLAERGVELPNFLAQTLTAYIEYADEHDIEIDPDVREVINLRKLASAKSPSKFAAFKSRGCEVEDDDSLLVMRDTYVFNGGHTGRHTSKGFQSQNLKRECASELEVDILLNDPLDHVRLLVGEPLKIAGNAVRPMVRARKGKKLLIGDFSKIETCVLFAVAGEKRGLEMLRTGQDLYRDLASKIFHKPLADINDFERQLGKQGILGCGFGVGADAFIVTAAKYGMKLPFELSKLTVDTYRDDYATVKKLWGLVEKAIVLAIHGTPNSLGLIKFAADKDQLVIQLPSGRKLRYKFPTLEGGKVRFWREDPKTKQWVQYQTWGGHFVENIVQAIANDLQRLAALDLEAELFDLVLHSHDELVAEDDEARAPRFKTVMELSENPAEWITKMGIPVRVDMKVTERYRK